MNKLRLANKIALITGAARGIGAATAELMVSEGAFVILTDIQDVEGEALAQKLGTQKAIYHALDVSQESDWLALEDWIQKKYGYLNVLFNNAGILGQRLDPEHDTIENWHHVQKTNLDSIFLGCRMGIRLMKDKGGSIINMASRSGIVGQPHSPAYAASKAAIRNHTRSVALYCAEAGYPIRCNTVSPASILTDIWEPMLQGPDRQAALDKLAAQVPLHRMGKPLDVAEAVVYLASDAANFVTGSEIIIDGGILAGAGATLTASTSKINE